MKRTRSADVSNHRPGRNWQAGRPLANFVSGFSQTLTTRYEVVVTREISDSLARVSGRVVSSEVTDETPPGHVTVSSYAGT